VLLGCPLRGPALVLVEPPQNDDRSSPEVDPDGESRQARQKPWLLSGGYWGWDWCWIAHTVLKHEILIAYERLTGLSQGHNL
jgi:hypothetical protein